MPFRGFAEMYANDLREIRGEQKGLFLLMDNKLNPDKVRSTVT